MVRKPPRLPLPWTGYALLDKTATKIGIHKSVFHALHGIPKRPVGDLLAALEARERLQLVESHSASPSAHGHYPNRTQFTDETWSGAWFPCLRRLASARRLHGMTGTRAGKALAPGG